MSKTVLVSDFDGTISCKDFFWYAIDGYLTPADLEPWRDFEQNKINHVTALARIFEKIKIPQAEFDKFVLELPVEEHFVDTVTLCGRKDIPVYVVSAGADYYIKKIFKKLGVDEKVKLISNPSHFSQEEGLVFEKINPDYKFFSSTHGVSKLAVVNELKSKGYHCIFCGDGTPDFDAAQAADIVFARGALQKLCAEAQINTQEFDSYFNIYEYIKNL